MSSIAPDGSNIPRYTPRIEEQKSVDNTEVQDEASVADGTEGQASQVKEKQRGASPFEVFSKGTSKATQASDWGDEPRKPPNEIESGPFRNWLMSKSLEVFERLEKHSASLRKMHDEIKGDYYSLRRPIDTNSDEYKNYIMKKNSYDMEIFMHDADGHAT